MRIGALLIGVCLVTGVLSAQSLSDRTRGPGSQLTQPMPSHPPGTGTMPVRARIQVVPLDLAISRQAEFESLKSRVERAEADASRLEPADPGARELLYRQGQLLRTLLSYAQKQNSDVGKRPAAMEVQRHLNEIEGRVMCEACHTGVVAKK